MIGLELTVDATPVVAGLPGAAGPDQRDPRHVVRLLPALNLTDEQLDEGCDVLAEVLREVAP